MRLTAALFMVVLMFIAGVGVGRAVPSPSRPALQPQCLPPALSPWKFSSQSASGRTYFTATISVVCPAGVSYTLSLVSSTGCMLERDGSSIPYAVFSDPGHAQQVLSCTLAPVDSPLSSTGSHVFLVYGEAFVDSHVLAAGQYSDNVRAVLTYGASYAP